MSNTSTTGSELVFEFQPLTPAGTLEAAPVKIDMPLPSYEVQFIEWKVPPGPNGHLGWQIWYSNSLVIPQNGTWIVTSDESGKWEIDELPINGDWQFYGYNTGTYDHTTYLRFLLNPLYGNIDLTTDMTVQTING